MSIFQHSKARFYLPRVSVKGARTLLILAVLVPLQGVALSKKFEKKIERFNSYSKQGNFALHLPIMEDLNSLESKEFFSEILQASRRILQMTEENQPGYEVALRAVNTMLAINWLQLNDDKIEDQIYDLKNTFRCIEDTRNRYQYKELKKYRPVRTFLSKTKPISERQDKLTALQAIQKLRSFAKAWSVLNHYVSGDNKHSGKIRHFERKTKPEESGLRCDYPNLRGDALRAIHLVHVPLLIALNQKVDLDRNRKEDLMLHYLYACADRFQRTVFLPEPFSTMRRTIGGITSSKEEFDNYYGSNKNEWHYWIEDLVAGIENKIDEKKSSLSPEDSLRLDTFQKMLHISLENVRQHFSRYKAERPRIHLMNFSNIFLVFPAAVNREVRAIFSSVIDENVMKFKNQMGSENIKRLLQDFLG